MSPNKNKWEFGGCLFPALGSAFLRVSSTRSALPPWLSLKALSFPPVPPVTSTEKGILLSKVPTKVSELVLTGPTGIMFPS